MKKVPQISRSTGVSCDYFNAWAPLFCSSNREGLLKDLPNFPILRYEELYSSSEYEGVVTDENRSSIHRLNELADDVNSLVDSPNIFEWDELLEMRKEVRLLIYGR